MGTVHGLKAAAILGAVLAVAAAVLVTGHLTGAGGVERRVVGLFEVSSAGAEGPARLTEENALALAIEGAVRALGDARSVSADAGRTFANVGGRSATIDDLELVQFTYIGGVTNAESRAGARFSTSRPMDVWIAVFERAGVVVPEWGVEDAVLTVEVYVDDTEGEVRSAGARVVNPNATRTPPPARD